MPYLDNEKRKSYHNNYNKKYYQEHKKKILDRSIKRKRGIIKWFNSYKSKIKCSFCDVQIPVCIDFHHIDKSLKNNTVSQLVSDGCSIETIKKEIDKCIPVCATHHRQLHYEKSLLNL